MTVQAVFPEVELPELVQHILSELSPSGLVQSLGPGAADVPSDQWESALVGPLREFLGRPGKGVRQSLVESAFEMVGGGGAPPREASFIVELLHAGSLIIDDIEDASAVRRGGPALHRLVGEPLAINTGSWLYFHAEELASRLGLEPSLELELRQAVGRAVLACHTGQALDLSTNVGVVAQRQIPGLVRETARLKTGSLLSLAGRVGALAARADARAVQALSEFGESLGVGLQMLDDLSGIELERRCHKGHEDLLQARPTWTWAWLALDLDELSFSRLQRSVRAVRSRDLHPEVLAQGIRKQLASSGTKRVSRHFENLIGALGQNFGPSAARRELETKVQRLRDCYV